MAENPVWNKVFIEIALRAIRKLHIDYSPWGFGQEYPDDNIFNRINQGPSIEVAPEIAVCAAISQEFIYSRFTNGPYFENEHRFYEIQREVRFQRKSFGKTGLIADLFLDRYKFKNSELLYYKFPAIIQAKRAHYFTPSIASGNLNPIENQWKNIKQDIIKLIELKKITDYNISLKKYNGNLKGAFLYTLFWGISENNEFGAEEFPDVIIKKLDNDLVHKENLEIRWFPLAWNNITLSVIKWFWLVLLEISPYEITPTTEDENWFSFNQEK
jgi:hypothetical protein